MGRKLKYGCCIGILLLAWGRALSEEYRFRYYTDINGLPSNTVQCLFQDTGGYLWIGTHDGLCRFNSSDFTVFQASDARNAFDNDCVYSLCGETSTGHERIWVGTNDGIYVFDTATESFAPLPVVVDGRVYRNLLVWKLVADRYGGIWIGTIGNGAFRCDLATGLFTHFDSYSHPQAFTSDFIAHILSDKDDHIWLACDRSLLRYNPENHAFDAFEVSDYRQHTAISRISCMAQDSFGNIWIAGYGSEIYRFDVPQLTFTANRPAGYGFGRIRSLAEYAPGVLLLGTDSGLVNFEVASRTFRLVDNGNSNREGRLNDKFVHSIIKDCDGGIWIGTYFGGVNYLSPYSTLFSTLERERDCGHIISKFCEDNDGNIWIGSDDGGLSRYNPRTNRCVREELDPDNPALNIHALAADGHSLWVGTYGDGLYRMDLRSRRTDHFTARQMGLDNLDVYSLFRDSQGILWIGTKNGICRFDDATETISCLYEVGYSNDVVDIREDMTGRVWFASLGHGLIVYDRNSGVFSKLQVGGGFFEPDFIGCLSIGGDNVWIGTHGDGLYRYDVQTGEMVHEMSDTIYAHSSILQIIQNGEELWLTTNHGLLQYKYRVPRIYVYTSDDGLLANIFNANSGFKSLSGHIYLGCNKGINRFYPYDFADLKRSARQKVVFSNIRLYGQGNAGDRASGTEAIDYVRKVRIRGSRISFSLDFTALNYASPTRTVYRYRLENFDETWKTSEVEIHSGRQHVFYANLSPGHYRFTVCASDTGEEFGEESHLDLEIRAPWWLARSMKILYGILLSLGICAAVYRVRRRMLLRHRQQIEALMRQNDMEHMQSRMNFMVASANAIRPLLSLISNLTSDVQNRARNPDLFTRDMEQLHRNSVKLLSAIHEFSATGASGILPDTEPAAAGGPKGQQESAPEASAGKMFRPQETGKDIAGSREPQVSILLVENDDEYAAYCMRYLSRHYAVTRLSEESRVMELLLTSSYSAVVAEIEGLGIDGLALCKAVKADGNTADIPVIMLTSNHSLESRMQALRAGADACVERSFGMTYLETQIRTLVDSRKGLLFRYSRQPYLASEEPRGGLSNSFMERFMNYITHHISENLNTDDLADAMNVSRTQLFTRIRNFAGTTPNDFLRGVRLKTAAELLAQQNGMRISEICYKTGFSSTSYFAKCFKEQFGMSPNEYMRLHRGEK